MRKPRFLEPIRALQFIKPYFCTLFEVADGCSLILVISRREFL